MEGSEEKGETEGEGRLLHCLLGMDAPGTIYPLQLMHSNWRHTMSRIEHLISTDNVSAS